MEMEDQLTPTQIKIIAGWSHNYRYKLYALDLMIYAMNWIIIDFNVWILIIISNDFVIIMLKI